MLVLNSNKSRFMMIINNYNNYTMINYNKFLNKKPSFRNKFQSKINIRNRFQFKLNNKNRFQSRLKLNNRNRFQSRLNNKLKFSRIFNQNINIKRISRFIDVAELKFQFLGYYQSLIDIATTSRLSLYREAVNISLCDGQIAKNLGLGLGSRLHIHYHPAFFSAGHMHAIFKEYSSNLSEYIDM
ncbi:unnamed protein product [Ambrosiozyma monospora]|uniref:Unnamed protein product n=1 Tax=Ambrosiozyma monospora TaxID=43982 RepID=A0ACB5TD57_AMBMO|nr:unnamed protein product [Ambrosiozyma monospora]